MFGFFKQRSSQQHPNTASAIGLFKRGDYEGALREANMLIERYPEVALSHRFKGEALFHLGHFDKSIEALEVAERIGGPGTEEVFFWRALAHANAGRPKDALVIFQGYIARPDTNPELVKKCLAAVSSVSRLAASGA